MEVRGRSLKIFALSALLVLGANAALNGGVKLVEGAYDEFNNTPTLNLKNQGHIGVDETVAYSDMYAQYGIDNDNNYWVRFATAIKGNVESLSYTREAVQELGETEAVTKEVTTVYKGVSSNGVASYYNAETGLSTDEADSGNYYWACYSIKIENSAFYSTPISMSFTVDDEVVKTRTVSLDSLMNTQNVYRFEAENSKITGNSSSGSTSDMGHACFETSTYISPKFSGGVCIRNNYLLDMTFDFNASNDDESAKLRLFMSTRAATTLSTIFNIVVNEVALDLTEVSIPNSDNAYVPGSTYFNMIEVEVPVSLLEGANSITIGHGTSGSTNNLDYIEVVTNSEVTGWVDTPFIDYEDVELSISVNPTHTAPGKLEVTCTHEQYGKEHASSSYEIPALSDTEFYTETRDEANSETDVEFVISGNTYGFSYKDVYTLRLNGATFSDGSSSKTFTLDEINSGLPSEMLANVSVNAPEGKVLYGWYDLNTKAMANVETFAMSYADSELEAVFQPAEYVKAGSGHLDFGVQASQAYLDNTKNVTNLGDTNNRTLGRIAPNTLGTIVKFSYKANDTAVNGSRIRIKTGYDRQANVAYSIEYTMSNLGADAIEFDVYQINSQTSTADNFKQSVSLEPGEVTTFTINFKFGGTNGHLLTYFVINGQYTNAAIGVAAKISN